MRPTNGGRSRMVLSKSRTGCQTCKERRVKCDEAKPACQRCVRSKRQCTGYIDITASNKKAQAFKITYYVPQMYWKTGISEDIEEEHALDCFFYWNTNCFPLELTRPFRRQDILHEPAIRHAMVAMGILHEIYRYQITGPPETQRRIIAMQHYGKAIQSLLSRQKTDAFTTDRSKKTMSISLLACLLFVSLELSQGHYQSALDHLQSGFALFQGVTSDEQQSPKDDSYVSAKVLRSLFVRFMCQITHFDMPDCARFLVLDESTDDYPAGFPGLEEARESFLAILIKILSRHQTRLFEKQIGLNDRGDNSLIQDQTLSEELLELDRWIFSFNLYLTHDVPTSQVCDSYVLVTCAFSLKFRLLMESRAGGQIFGNTELDLTHIANLGDTLVRASPDPVTCSTCPLHRIFNNTQNIPQDKNNNNSALKPSSHPLFPFLGVFCSIFVSSTYSQNASIRRKTYDTVSKICRCGKGFDLGLTAYIASLLRPSDSELTVTRSIPHDSVFGQVLSDGCWKLLTVLHSFSGLK
uniref:Zn2Cys6 fungal transcriptional regulatory protein TP06213 n=1 Tax=Talaromyces pinophilus TaxID=128442 RepID=A0A3G2KSH8_TALPI|nr:Zn2Cys6 fungal transcriptional regulatory protein TP06213 [Talaromyces pinophilus]